jgi:M6 family metalloprotease-like protein
MFMVFGTYFKTIRSFACVLGTLSVVSFAYPVNPLPRTVDNGGDSLAIRTLGDEHYRYTQTEDGFLVVADSAGIYYFADDKGAASKFKAKNKGERSAAAEKFLNKLDKKNAFKKHRERHPDRHKRPSNAARAKRASWVPVSSMADSSNASDANLPPVLRFPKPEGHANGTNRFPVLLIEDNSTKNLDSASLYAILNQENYTRNGYTGSVRDYFVDQSSGKFVPSFDLYLVKVNSSLSSYMGRDYALIQEGISQLKKKYTSFNASLYDSDNDGDIDALPVLYAGAELSSGGKTLGGYQYELQWNECGKQDAGGGKRFNSYFLIQQKEQLFPTFVHEFSHTMGLRDHYCVASDACYSQYQNSQYQAPGAHAWDVMATGMYNNNGLTPPNYSAFERNFMGWLDYTTLDDDFDVKMLPPLNSGNYALHVKVSSNEWFVFENRQMVKWDSALPNHGMLVWHIDYSQKTWDDDVLNDDPAHQRVDVVEAGNKRVTEYYDGFGSYGGGNLVDDPFPGSQNVTQLSPLKSWSGTQLLSGIFNITEKNSNVCFSTNQSVSVGGCEIAASSSSVAEISSSSEPKNSSSSIARSSSSSELKRSSSSRTRSSSSTWVWPVSSSSVMTDVSSSSWVSPISSSSFKWPESSSSFAWAGLSSSAENAVRVTPANAAGRFEMRVVGNIVMLTGIPNEARITVMDISGHSIMMQENVVQTRGMASVNMQPYGSGIYLVNIRGKFADGKTMNKTVKVMRR